MTNLSRHEAVYDRDYVEDVEDRLERREKIALGLAKQLNAKIDECEALKKEISILRGYVDAVNSRLDVEK